MPHDYTIVDAIEGALGIPLTEKALRHTSGISTQQLQHLAIELEDYHQHGSLPLKEESHLRPILSANAAHGWKLGLDYVFSAQHFVEGRYTFEPRGEPIIGPNAKRFLLYAHSLAFLDPLPYLLDFFRHSPDGELARVRAPAVLALLKEYATLRELLRNQILIPISMGADDLMDGYLSKAEEAELQVRLPMVDPVDLRIMASYIRAEQARVRRFENRVDLFLPTTEEVPVLRELMRIAQTKFTSEQVREPFGAAVLATIKTINPRAITIADIVRMRNDEDAFHEWRLILQGALERLHASAGDYTDADGEFAVALRHQVTEWTSRLADKKRKSSVLSQALEGGGAIALGATAGAVSGFVAGGGGLLGVTVGGAIGGATQPLIEGLLNIGKAMSGKATVTTFRNHFLAMGAEPPL